MKKILFLLTALLFATITSAQEAPAGYDGGSELQDAIRKVRSGKKVTPKKTKSVKKKTTVVNEIKPPVRTVDEAVYYNTYGTDSPSYLKKLVNSEYWEAQKQLASQAEIESEKRYAEQAEQRRTDSIATARKKDSIAIEQEKIQLRYKQINDSSDRAVKLQREAYLNEIRQEQKNNKPRTIFSIFKKKT